MFGFPYDIKDSLSQDCKIVTITITEVRTTSLIIVRIFIVQLVI